MAKIYEHDPSQPLGPDDEDGMQEFMEDADRPLSTDYDIRVENPPHEGYNGPLPHPNLPKRSA